MKLRGGALTIAQQLLAEWARSGLFLVPLGELESWWPEGPASSKSEWISAASSKVDATHELASADDFVKDIYDFELRYGSSPAPSL